MIVAAAPPPSQILNGNGNQKLESLEEKWNVRIWIQFGRPECLCWQFRWRSKASSVGLVDAFNWHCRIVNSGEFDIQYLSFFQDPVGRVLPLWRQNSTNSNSWVCFVFWLAVDWFVYVFRRFDWLTNLRPQFFDGNSVNPRNQFKISMIVSYAAFRVVVI